MSNTEPKDKKFYTTLSKTISYALRHAPEKFGLELDEKGRCSVETLLEIMRRHFDRDDIELADIEEIMRTADKKRYDITDGQIRACHGHSLPVKIHMEPAVPPAILYHGTSHKAAERIAVEGLKPGKRQYVHLSTTIIMAQSVGHRKDQNPVILVIRAKEAHQVGVVFYRSSDDVWLADSVPPEFIDRPV